MREIVLILNNIRSTHNVGSLLRTADGFGVTHVYLTGYTPFPLQKNDARLPHIANKLTCQIHKTALGAENTINWTHQADVLKLMSRLKADGFNIIGLEQSSSSIALPDYNPPAKSALLLGSEVDGINPALLKNCDETIEIPMYGKKESFNVTQATAVALYHLRETGSA